MEVLQGILVKDGYLIANSIDISVKVKIDGAKGESFIIPMKAFDLISNLPPGEVEITAPNDESILIKAGKIRNKYQTMKAVNFPINDVDTESEDITINSSQLIESIKRVLFAIPQTSSNRVMTALCMDADGDFLNFAGLDGHVMAWDKIDYSGSFTMLIPRETAEKLLTIGLIGDVSIKKSEKSAIFATQGIEIYTRLINGQFFRYKNAFKSINMSLNTSIKRTDLLDAMTRAKMCTSENKPVKFSIVEDVLNISIKDSFTDYAEDLVLNDALSQDFTACFNAKLILEALKAFDCENVGIQLMNAKTPMILEAEDSDFRAMVLPVAIRQNP
jgi:DNA polymerase III sliding clamp (beta) subunit (PCNA family)